MTFDPQTLPYPFHYESTGTYKQNTAVVFTSPIKYDALRPRNSKISTFVSVKPIYVIIS